MRLKKRATLTALVIALTASLSIPRVKNWIYNNTQDLYNSVQNFVDRSLYDWSNESIGKKYRLEHYTIEEGDRIIKIAKNQYLSKFIRDYNNISYGNLKPGTDILIPVKDPNGKTIVQLRKEAGLF